MTDSRSDSSHNRGGSNRPSESDSIEDLSSIVLNIKKRKGDKYNSQLVHHPVTRAFLDGGMALVAHDLSSEPDQDEGLPSFQSLRRKDIVVESQKFDPRATEGAFRNRWEFLPLFFGDLVRYALRSTAWSPRATLHLESEDRLSDGSDELASLVNSLALRDLDEVGRKSTALQFKFVLTSFTTREGATDEVLAESYNEALSYWERLFETILADRALHLRPGVSVADLAGMVHAASEGMSMRILLGSDHDPAGRGGRRSLLGSLILAVLASCIDTGDGKSLESLVNDLGQSRASV